MKQKKYQLQQVGTSGSYSRYALVAEGVSRVTDSTTIEQQYGKDTSFLGSGEVGDATTGILETSDGKLFEYVNYGDDNDMPYTLQQLLRRNMVALGSGEVGDATTGILETSDGKLFEYVNYGDDNDMPYTLQQLLRRNMVAQRAMAFNVQCCYGQGVRFMDRETKQDTTDSEIRDFCLKNSIHEVMVAQRAMAFNVQCCYGQGVRFMDRETKQDTTDSEIRDFCLKNSIHEVFMQQATDMKFFFWSVEVIILSRDHDHSKIVNIRHKDVSYCRLEVPNEKGRIEHVFFGDFRNVMSPVHTEVIPLLDFYDPLGDLMARMGKAPDPYTGITGKAPEMGKDCKFAIISRIPLQVCHHLTHPDTRTAVLSDTILCQHLRRCLVRHLPSHRYRQALHDQEYVRSTHTDRGAPRLLGRTLQQRGHHRPG